MPPVFTRKLVLAGEAGSNMQPMTMNLVGGDPNGVISGVAGDIAFLSGGLTQWRCTGGTSWRTAGIATSMRSLNLPFNAQTRLLPLVGLRVGSFVSSCYIRVESSWNLPGATVRIGTSALPEALLAPQDASLYVPGRYDPLMEYMSATEEELQLVISGPSTTGSGVVTVTYLP